MICCLCAGTFVNELSAALFKFHEPDRQMLKQHLIASGVSEQEIQQKPFKFWKDR